MPNTQDLYDYLKANGALSDSVSFDAFSAEMQDDARRKSLYGYMGENGFLSEGTPYSDFRGTFDTPLESLGNTAKGIIESYGRGAEELVGGAASLAGKVIPGNDWFEGFAKASKDAAIQRERAGITSGPQNTYEGAKRQWDRGDILGAAGQFIGATGEAGAGSAPGMSTMAMPGGGPLFWGSQMENMANQRAENDGRESPNAADYALSAPSAAMQAALEKLGIKGLTSNPFTKKLSDGLMARLGKDGMNLFLKSLNEAGTEGGQQLLQYATEVINTNKPFDWGEARRQATIAAVGGFGLGAGIGAAQNVLVNTSPEAQVADAINAQVDGADISALKVPDFRQEVAPSAGAVMAEQMMGPKPTEAPFAKAPDVQYPDALAETLRKQSVPPMQEPKLLPAYAEQVVSEPQVQQEVAQDVVKPDERVADADASITQWRDEWARLKRTGDLRQMNEFGVKVGAVLNGIAQKYGDGVVDQFRALQEEMKEYAISRDSDTAKAQVAIEQPKPNAQEATPPQQVSTVTPAESVGGTLVDAQPTTDGDIEPRTASKADGQVDYVPVNEAKSVLDAFESMEIVDQTHTMVNTFERKKTGKKKFQFDRFAKSQRVRKEMLGKGYIKPDNTLTKEGERLLAEIKQNTQALSDGIPMDTYKKKRVSKMKYDPLRGALVGTFYGKPAHSNGHVLLQGDPDIGPESRTGVDMSKVAPEEPTGKPYARAVAWGGSGINASSARLLYLNDGETTAAVDADLYDYVTGKVKGAQFRITGPTSAIYIYSKGDVVGLLMPVRMEGNKAPAGVQKLASQGNDNLGRPGAATSIELNPTKEFKPIRFLERLEVSEIVDPETKRDIKSWWYEPVSHMETETKAAEWVKDMTPEVAAEFAMDANTKVDPTTRNFIGMAAGKKLNSMAAKARKDGDIEKASELSRRAAAVYQFVGEKGTELGRAIEILKTFDQDNPAKVIGEYKKSVDEAREGVAPVVGDIVTEVKQVQGDTAEQAAGTDKVVDAVRKVVRKRDMPLGERVKAGAARGIAQKLSASIAPGRQMTNLQIFSRNLISAMSEKLPAREKGAAKPNYDALLEDAVLNKDAYMDAWEKARAITLDKHPEAADTINKVFDDVDSTIPMKAVRGAIQQELEAMQTSLSEVARQHYTTLALTGKHLAVRIAERLNISNAEASELADVIDAEYRRMVGKRIASTLRALSKKRADVRRVIKSDIERIVELSNLGALNDEAIYEAVSGRLNLPPYNPEVVGKLNQLASELQELSYLDEGFGRSVEYWQKRKEMLDYRLSLTPSHKLKVATAVVSRGIMLMSVKSPITNIVGNSVLSVTESLSRRLVNKRVNGLNGEYAMQYFKYVQEVYQKSGYDPTRMVSLAEDQKRLGEKVVNTQGEGRTRRTGRFVEDIVFKQMMGAPDVAFAAAHFVDTVNILTTNAARAEGLINEKQTQARALEIFKDAVKIEPETEIGKAVREKAIADAKRATLTDDTYASKVALNARNLINNLTGDLMLGDLIVPFAKTPANVVMRAIESSGVKLPYDLYNIAFGVKNGDVEQVSRGMRGAAMAGVGVVGAHLLAALLNPDDFEGEYFMADSKEKALVRSIGGSYTAFKIGNTWVSADYFGPFAAALVGIMNDKKYGKGRGVIDRTGNYYASVFGQLTRIPGLNELGGVVDGVKRAVKDLHQRKKGFADLGSDAVSGLIDFATPRIIPALLSDVASAFDPYRRDIDGPVGSVMYRVPGLRNLLPEKLDLFGRPIENQSPVTAILFGARFREGRDSELLNELQRLNAGGQLPTIEDIRYTSTRVKKLRDQLGEKDFKRAMRYFGDEFTKRATSLIHSSRYRRMTDEERKEAWGDVRSDARNRMLRRFRYRK